MLHISAAFQQIKAWELSWGALQPTFPWQAVWNPVLLNPSSAKEDIAVSYWCDECWSSVEKTKHLCLKITEKKNSLVHSYNTILRAFAQMFLFSSCLLISVMKSRLFCLFLPKLISSGLFIKIVDVIFSLHRSCNSCSCFTWWLEKYADSPYQTWPIDITTCE